MRLSALALAALLIATCSTRLYADEVLFKNGDHLTGRIVSLSDDKLTIASWPAGTVTVPLEKVSTFSTDEAIEIHLHDGTVIRQRVAASDDGHVAVEGEGTIRAQTFALADIETINPPKPRWQGDITAGFALTRSNTDTESANLSVALTRKTDVDRIAVNARALYGRQEDPDSGERTTTENSWSLDGKYDYFVSERLFVYGNGGVARDEILDLNLRLIAGAGVGRDWVERDDFSVRTEGGLSWLYEDYADGTDTSDTVTARLAYAVAKRFSKRVEVTHELAWYPALDDFGDYFLTTQLGVRVTLTELMFGDFKVLYDHDSTPAAGVDEDSLKTILGLGASF